MQLLSGSVVECCEAHGLVIGASRTDLKSLPAVLKTGESATKFFRKARSDQQLACGSDQPLPSSGDSLIHLQTALAPVVRVRALSSKLNQFLLAFTLTAPLHLAAKKMARMARP